jgi:UDP-N-acetylglucosamine 2-epimerase (non-hydrolysing)
VKVLTLFGTRPEIIKLAPVIRCLDAHLQHFSTVNVASAQHTDLLYPFVRAFGIRIDRDLGVMRTDQTPSDVCARVLSSLDPILTDERPELILVQGDTTTTLAGALAGFHRRIPVGHVEAGLRTGDVSSPFPEEMNRRLVGRLASVHFAATEHNRSTLLAEGVADEDIVVTGNPVVDAVHSILDRTPRDAVFDRVMAATTGTRRVLLTTHRRENLGPTMEGNLRVLRRFVDDHPDVSLIFPVHPNPSVRSSARALAGHDRIHLIEPMDYEGFIHLMAQCWLVVSDSGGVQEEAPSVGTPVVILRDTTERPEAVASGVARLVGGGPDKLAALMDEVERDREWVEGVSRVDNPFGRGDAADRIVTAIMDRCQPAIGFENRARPENE